METLINEERHSSPSGPLFLQGRRKQGLNFAPLILADQLNLY